MSGVCAKAFTISVCALSFRLAKPTGQIWLESFCVKEFIWLTSETKKMQIEIKYLGLNLKNVTTPPTPPPLPPKPKFLVTAKPTVKPSTLVSVTNQEIDKYWRQKRMDEEDHLLAAIKAAARIRARSLSEDDYQRFKESLKEDDDDSKENNKSIKSSSEKDEKSYEIRVGIKDWWTKSKYAYLNEPVTQSKDIPKRRASSYIPQFYCYKSAPPPATTTFGIV